MMSLLLKSNIKKRIVDHGSVKFVAKSMTKLINIVLVAITLCITSAISIISFLLPKMILIYSFTSNSLLKNHSLQNSNQKIHPCSKKK